MHPSATQRRAPARRLLLLLFVFLMTATLAWASIFGTVQGIVHDPVHRPIAGAQIELHALHSSLILHAISNQDGAFTIPSVALGDYRILITKEGFAPGEQQFTLASGTSPLLHFALQLVTPTSLVDRQDIAQTPGADRTNSMAMIVDYTPGAYMTHDMLHMRGGHQLNWQIDGVEIPNTNIASNLAAQIDPKDIDYIEIQLHGRRWRPHLRRLQRRPAQRLRAQS